MVKKAFCLGKNRSERFFCPQFLAYANKLCYNELAYREYDIGGIYGYYQMAWDHGPA